jgi:ureidoacrylate peracid hydrolase
VSVIALDPARTALLVVDMQNDFCSPGGFFDTAGHDVTPCASLVAPLAKLVADVRATGARVVFTMTVRTEPQRQRLRPSRHPVATESVAPGTLGNDRYAPGAWGTAIVDGLTPSTGDLVIEKPRQSGFYRTSLYDDLEAAGVDTVAIAGVTTNCCVDTTARDAFMRDLDVVVLSDGVAAFGRERHLHDATLENLALFFGVVATSDELLAGLRA